jgi:hypothetical protein
VRNGLFAASEAAELFDRIFEARQPENFSWSSWASFGARPAVPPAGTPLGKAD